MTAADELLWLQDVPAAIGGNPPVALQTVRRWIKQGIPVAGELLKLRAERVGWRWRVRRSDLGAFLAACNPGPVERVSRETPAQAEERARQAAAAVTDEFALTGG